MSQKNPISKSRQSSTTPKITGFINNLGESNCFLNSALQVLFHLQTFRASIEKFGSCRSSKQHYCLLCGLKEILSDYTKKTSTERGTAIDISRLRAELAEKFESRNLFSINEPADSMEALSALLSSFHDEDVACKSCPAHDLFRIQVEETLICECKAQKKETWDTNTFFHHFYVNLIFEQGSEQDKYALLKKKRREDFEVFELSNVIRFENSLQKYIKIQWAESEYKTCPKDCKIAKSRKILKLLQPPKVFSINLIWKDFNPKLIQILQVLISVPYSLKLDSIYEVNCETVYNLKSVILYGRGHYICAIRTGHNKEWFKIDDERGKIVGDGSWIDFVIDCLKNRFFPVGLFYEEAENWEESGVAFNEWIKLETDLLNFMKNQEDSKEDDDWKCKCGNCNNSNWVFCTRCKLIRPGLSGWVCKICTFYNNSEETSCISCGEVKENLNTPKKQEVKKNPQKEMNSPKGNNYDLSKKLAKDETSTDSKMNSPEKLIRRNEPPCDCTSKPCVCTICPQCGSKMVKICKKCLVENRCFDCSQPLSFEKSRICAWCRLEVESSQCKKCFNKPKKRACSSCWKNLKKCDNCEYFNKINQIRCSNCSHENLNHSNFNVQQKKQENPNQLKKNCNFCDSKFISIEDKYCENCIHNKKKCQKCEGIVAICKSCLRSKEECKSCGSLIEKGQKCKSSSCSSTGTPNVRHMNFNLLQKEQKDLKDQKDLKEQKDPSTLDHSTKTICTYCNSKISSKEEKFCINCFEYSIKCRKCDGKLIICKSCFTLKEKCKSCGYPLEKGSKCKNSDCLSYTQESKPRTVKDSIKSCELCEDLLPSYGFCLFCKLKLKSDRCLFCSSETCHKFCEKCIHFNKKCKSCRNLIHISREICLSCN
jgi:hypothetical protein